MSLTQFAPWLPNDKDLQPFYDGICKFVDEHLAPISKRSKRELLSITSKSVLDPLLGYIHLRPWETALIDTRLFQRLRRIRQLGLANLAFPTLGYSRFEHSLGVVGRLNQVLARLVQIHSADKMKSMEVVETIRQYELPLRLAALFHDVGHCSFSHVSERVFGGLNGGNGYPSTKRLREAFSASLQSRKLLAAAEVLSIAIVSCPSIRHLASQLDIPDKTDERIDQWFEQTARFIAGAPVRNEPKTVFLAQLLSSGLDADKLDYMTREAYFSGIPLGIDLNRILDKIRVFKCAPEQLPEELRRLKGQLPGTEYFVLGLAHGAQFAFEEFCIARVPLYDKIYLHQKIRAAEAQLQTLLLRLPEIVPEYNQLHRWLFLKESMVEHEEIAIPEQEDLGDLFSMRLSRAESLKLAPIRDRVLLQRGFAAGLRNALSEAPRTSELQRSPTLSFINKLRDNPARFISAIRKEVQNICEKLGRDPVPEALLADIIIDIPDHRRVQQGALSIYIKQPVTLPQRWVLPVDQVVSYYAKSRALSYVFAPREVCDLVCLATERVIWDQRHLQFEQKDFLADAIVARAEKIKRDLTARGYYDNAISLKLPSDLLLTAAAQEQIQKIVENLAEFTSFKGDKISPARVTAFVMQFPEKLQSAMLELTSKLEIIHPKAIAEKIVSEFKAIKNGGAKNVLPVPLGNLTDSANHLLYQFKNHPDEEIRAIGPQISQLTDFSLKDVDHLIVFDDNINTAAQAVNIFCQWLDVEIPNQWDLKETHVYPLREPAREQLRNLPITFVFGVGPETAPAQLKKALHEVCKIDPAKVSVELFRCLAANDKVLSGAASELETPKKQVKELTRLLSEIGTELMMNEGKSRDNAANRAMGDNHVEGTVLFPYNVPTMTITAFWCAGKYKGQDWLPLIERRRNRRASGELTGEDA